MSAISTEKFYGRKADESNEKKPKLYWIKECRKMPSHILGPTQFWMEFDKQAGALDTALNESTEYDMLCTFVYQGENGYRKFVVAHPEVYWWYYVCRPPEKRCSYEVIPQNNPCKLYLDLEFLFQLNPDSNGPCMTSTLIDIFSAYLLALWGLPCNRYDVMNLDSTTDEKFSRHVIFNIKDVAFIDNYHVGRLVKSVCNDILDYVSSKHRQYDVLSRFDEADLEKLVIKTKHGRNLFVDTAVYTKNRHFRIYKSTKWGKQSHLKVAQECMHAPSNRSNDKELSIFLDSLTTYFVCKRDLMLLEYSVSHATRVKRFKAGGEGCRNYKDDTDASRFPVLDEYIRKIVYPGKIRLCKYFDISKTLIYETVGYRYCQNIGRCHKSNNVFWIVDLEKKEMYQKCHDQDCAGFKSKPKKLPEEISFYIDEEDDSLLTCAAIAEDTLKQIDLL